MIDILYCNVILQYFSTSTSGNMKLLCIAHISYLLIYAAWLCEGAGQVKNVWNFKVVSIQAIVATPSGLGSHRCGCNSFLCHLWCGSTCDSLTVLNPVPLQRFTVHLNYPLIHQNLNFNNLRRAPQILLGFFVLCTALQ